MLIGKAPFHDLSEFLVFKRIERCNFTFPDAFPDDQAKELIKGLLRLKQNERIGGSANGGFNSLSTHPFFAAIDWKTVVEMESPLAKHFTAVGNNNDTNDNNLETF
jgi:3-phosphoinositide dependent protein kinase-1